VVSGLNRSIFVGIVFGLVGLVVGLMLTVRTFSAREAPLGPASARSAPAGRATARERSGLDASRRTAIVRAADCVGPATVSISVLARRTVRTSALPRSRFQDEFFERFFRGYFPENQYEQVYQAYGSGVIIDEDGYVLTNDHVIRGGGDIKVTLTDGRQLDARVLGGDPRFDLAVLKVEGEGLPYAPLGDSDDMMIGEWAIAIGNPFGYILNDPQPTVTAGVVSALHRDVISENDVGAVYKDMIQTDAAINPGNSGGPLVNSRGEVIGINSFIFSASGGSHGMGFAIPINVAKLIIDELIEYGRVRDVWVGVQVQDITPAVAQALHLSVTSGVLISQVEGGSPADRAGLAPGDVLVGVDGVGVDNVRQARREIFGTRVGDVVTFKVRRADVLLDFAVTLEEVPR